MRPCTSLCLAFLLLAFAGTVPAATYNCLPIELMVKDKSLQVLCANPMGEGGYPLDQHNRIQYFAVPKTDTAFVARFARIVQTALVSGLVVKFHYTSGDSSGTAFGCAADKCRRPTAVSLLAPRASVRIPDVEWPDGSLMSIEQGEWMHYGPYSISEHRYLLVRMTGMGNADLYVNKGSLPDESTFTCRPMRDTSNEVCIISVKPGEGRETAGTYYVGVKGVGPSNVFGLHVSIGTRVLLDEDFSFHVPCMDFFGYKFGATFRYHELFVWEMDLSSMNLNPYYAYLTGDFSCVPFRTDAGFDLPVVSLGVERYTFSFDWSDEWRWALNWGSLYWWQSSESRRGWRVAPSVESRNMPGVE